MDLGKLIRILTGIIIASILGLFIVFYVFEPDKKIFGLEIAKALIQIAGVFVLTQILNEWISSQKKKEEKKEKEQLLIDNKNQLRKALADRLIKAYFETKKIRRLLRANCYYSLDENEGNELCIDKATYNGFMHSLNETQLQLEIIKREITTSVDSKLFSSADTIKELIFSMEDYLRKVIDEYEHTLRNVGSTKLTITVSHFKNLSEFIQKIPDNGNSNFNKDFVDKHSSALKSIRNDILGVSTIPNGISKESNNYTDANQSQT